MRRTFLITAVLFLSGLFLGQAFAQFDFGDAPEGTLAYPATGALGMFPTCTMVGPAMWIQHTNFGAFFGPSFDFEVDGNGGLCPFFPPYDIDECFADGDAGLMFPPSYTIVGGVEVPCPTASAGSLGITCQTASWGTNVDIMVVNVMPGGTTGFVNVLMDWDQNGMWGGGSTCPWGFAPEHVLNDFPVPNGFAGPLSILGPPPFLIGPNRGFVWTRFTITEFPVGPGWTGEGMFEDGESEDYLLRVDYCPFLDTDYDGMLDCNDNCPNHPNGPNLGTCVKTQAGLTVSYRVGDPKVYVTCNSGSDCTATGGIACQKAQEDSDLDGCGDVCECYANFNYPTDTKVNSSDLGIYKLEFGRIDCKTVPPPCKADGNDDGKVNISDLGLLKNDFGRIDCANCP